MTTAPLVARNLDDFEGHFQGHFMVTQGHAVVSQNHAVSQGDIVVSGGDLNVSSIVEMVS